MAISPKGLPPKTTPTTEESTQPADLVDRGEALRILRVNASMLTRMRSRGEITGYEKGAATYYSREELEALAGTEDRENVLKEAVALLRQSFDHNEKLVGAFTGATELLMRLAAENVTRLHGRVGELETALWDARSTVLEAEREKGEHKLELLEAETQGRRIDALVRSAETAVPVMMAHFTKKSPAQDTAIATAVRALLRDGETRDKILAALPIDQRHQVMALVTAMQEPSSSSTPALTAAPKEPEPLSREALLETQAAIAAELAERFPDEPAASSSSKG